MEGLEAVAGRTAAVLNRIAGHEVASVELLLRPPFRFVHDVVMEVSRATGFGAGLWVGIELDALALRSSEGREGKLRFVKKLISLVWVGKGLPSPPYIRASKVLAGLEAENTNQLLQVGDRQGRPSRVTLNCQRRAVAVGAASTTTQPHVRALSPTPTPPLPCVLRPIY
jgi:TRAF3-interacting protein 1